MLLRLACSSGSVSRGDGGFRVALCLYILRFCEAPRPRLWLESRGHFQRLRHCRSHSRLDLATAGPLDRSVRTSTSHSSVHDDLCLRFRFVSFVTCQYLAVLSNVFHSGPSW